MTHTVDLAIIIFLVLSFGACCYIAGYLGHLLKTMPRYHARNSKQRRAK